MWCKNDLATGCLFQFDIYTGKKQNREGGLGKNVVLQLSKSLIATNVRLYFKIFVRRFRYSSSDTSSLSRPC